MAVPAGRPSAAVTPVAVPGSIAELKGHAPNDVPAVASERGARQHIGGKGSANVQSLCAAVLRVGQLPGGDLIYRCGPSNSTASPPPGAGQGAPALPSKLHTCLLAGTGCDTAAFAQRKDKKHGPCVPSPTSVSRKSTSSSPASFVFAFRNRLSFQYVDTWPRSG